jgi:chromosome segregation ATPase
MAEILGVIGVVAGGLFTWLGIRWRHGGTIRSSEAQQLWNESAAIRNEYRKEITELRLTIAGLRREIAEKDSALVHQSLELSNLRDELRTKDRVIADQERRIADLERRLERAGDDLKSPRSPAGGEAG